MERAVGWGPGVWWGGVAWQNAVVDWSGLNEEDVKHLVDLEMACDLEWI